MKLIVGLGNPGSQYDKTRHNAGFMVVDRLVRRHVAMGTLPKSRFQGICFEASIKESSVKGASMQGEKCLLLKPTTYMNLSGRSVAEALGFYKLDPAHDLLVLVDDVSLPSGSIRVRASGSAGGHNGLADIQRALASEVYSRVRIGIDACPLMMKLEDYVLGRFTPEQGVLLETAIDKACDAVELFIHSGIIATMNRFNASEKKPPPPSPPSTPPSPTSLSP